MNDRDAGRVLPVLPIRFRVFVVRRLDCVPVPCHLSSPACSARWLRGGLVPPPAPCLPLAASGRALRSLAGRRCSLVSPSRLHALFRCPALVTLVAFMWLLRDLVLLWCHGSPLRSLLFRPVVIVTVSSNDSSSLCVSRWSGCSALARRFGSRLRRVNRRSSRLVSVRV